MHSTLSLWLLQTFPEHIDHLCIILNTQTHTVQARIQGGTRRGAPPSPLIKLDADPPSKATRLRRSRCAPPFPLKSWIRACSVIFPETEPACSRSHMCQLGDSYVWTDKKVPQLVPNCPKAPNAHPWLQTQPTRFGSSEGPVPPHSNWRKWRTLDFRDCIRQAIRCNKDQL